MNLNIKGGYDSYSTIIKKMEISVGYNGSFEMLEKIFSVPNNKVKNVYTGGLKDFLSGGRNQYITSFSELEKHVKYVHSQNATINLALNTPLDIKEKNNKEWWDKIEKYFKNLENIGVDGVILSHPFLIETVKKVTNLEVTLSTICEVTDVRDAIYYEELGVDVIVPSSKINYNIKTLKEIKKGLKKAKIKLMVNEYCLGGCPLRKFHWNHLALNKDNTDSDYSDICFNSYMKDKYKVLTNTVVRPEDIPKYNGIIDSIKLIGRTSSIKSEFLENTIAAYSNQKFDGNFIELSSLGLSRLINIPNKNLDDLFEARKNCNFVCHICNKCKDIFDNSQENIL